MANLGCHRPRNIRGARASAHHNFSLEKKTVGLLTDHEAVAGFVFATRWGGCVV